ncbi:MAG: hypothetical protein WCK57_06310 [Verrucomicrobiae bacterium]
MNAKSPTIVATLKACPSQHASVSRERFQEGWNELCREDVTPLIKPTVPVMAALLLHDDRFRALLNPSEQEQLHALIQLALDRYEQQTNPPNKLGRLIAGIIKE